MSVAYSSVAAAYRVEACVIGAGVIGIAVARALAQAGKEVLLLDRAKLIGSETSARNSEVIHAGLYYPPTSLKGKFCVRGKHLLYDYCQSRHVSYKQCGKLVVATNEIQWTRDLPRIKEQAIANGAGDIELYSREQVQAIGAPSRVLWCSVVSDHWSLGFALVHGEPIGRCRGKWRHACFE